MSFSAGLAHQDHVKVSLLKRSLCEDLRVVENMSFWRNDELVFNIGSPMYDRDADPIKLGHSFRYAKYIGIHRLAICSLGARNVAIVERIADIREARVTAAQSAINFDTE